MLKFLKDLVLGEPAMSLGIVSTGFGAAVLAISSAGEVIPLWLAIATPTSAAVAAIYTRQTSTPTHPSPLTRNGE